MLCVKVKTHQTHPMLQRLKATGDRDVPTWAGQRRATIGPATLTAVRNEPCMEQRLECPSHPQLEPARTAGTAVDTPGEKGHREFSSRESMSEEPCFLSSSPAALGWGLLPRSDATAGGCPGFFLPWIRSPRSWGRRNDNPVVSPSFSQRLTVSEAASA